MNEAEEKDDPILLLEESFDEVKIEGITKSVKSWLKETSHGIQGADLVIKGLHFIVTVEEMEGIKTISSLFQRNKNVKLSKPILQDISFALQPGQMTAILGGPSSGKTTILDAIAQNPRILRAKGELKGDILLNGQSPNQLVYHRHVGYVGQEDIHNQSLTVEETLFFAAKLQMEHTDENEIRNRVDGVMQILRLKHRKDTVVGGPLRRGISGGERRRLTIGLELVKDPTFFLLDEPTTGLDATAALRIGKVLKCVAELGKPILCSLLQPSWDLLSLFDNIIIISRGEMAYWGPRDQALGYFENLGYRCPKNYSASEFLSEIVDHPEKFEQDDLESQPSSVIKRDDFIES